MSFIKRIIIFSVVALAVISLVFILGIIPLFFGIKESVNKIIAEKKSALSFEEEAAVAEQFEKEYGNMELNPKNIDNFLASSSAPIDLIEFFENTAKESNLFIGISPYAPTKLKEDPWDSMGFSLELTGNFLDFLKFLEKTENGPYFIQTQKLQIKKVVLNPGSQSVGGQAAESVKAILGLKVFIK